MLKLVVLLLAFVTGSVMAETFEAGLTAYQRGDECMALDIWKPIAERGNAYAQSNLGLMYQTGAGVQQDDSNAIYWYRKAADQGHINAQFNLGLMYTNGVGLQKKIHIDEAQRWYRKAAEQGDAEAQYKLGRMYEIGTGALQSTRVAVSWYHKAAEQSFVPAGDALERLQQIEQINLLNPSAAAKNPETPGGENLESVKIARKARTDQQHDRSTDNLRAQPTVAKPPAWGSADSQPVERIERTDPYVQYRLGLRHLTGKGVPVDYVRAYAWLTLAKQQGSKKAAEYQTVIQRIMTNNQITEAQKLAGKLKTKP
ncbi:MAG: TPR repeat protein [Parasphingorhabdus sp.]|jgi:TPR repeat protein